jgi:hypothetical protein
MNPHSANDGRIMREQVNFGSSEDSGLTFRVQHFSVVSATCTCWKCTHQISVYAVLLSVEREASGEPIPSAPGAVLLSELSLVSDSAAVAIDEGTSGLYRQDH